MAEQPTTRAEFRWAAGQAKANADLSLDNLVAAAKSIRETPGFDEAENWGVLAMQLKEEMGELGDGEFVPQLLAAAVFRMSAPEEASRG